MHVGIAYMRWQGKRSRHSRRMRTRNFTYLARGPFVKLRCTGIGWCWLFIVSWTPTYLQIKSRIPRNDPSASRTEEVIADSLHLADTVENYNSSTTFLPVYMSCLMLTSAIVWQYWATLTSAVGYWTLESWFISFCFVYYHFIKFSLYYRMEF